MANRLKKIFSNEPVNYGGRLHFENDEAFIKVLEAIKLVEKEGKPVEVEDVSRITAEIRAGEERYPLLTEGEVTQIVIGPAKEEVRIPLDTEYGKKEILFYRYYTQTETILETNESEIVYFMMRFKKNSEIVTFSYRTQPQLAKTVKDIMETTNTAVALMDLLFKTKVIQNLSDEQIQLNLQRKYFQDMSAFYSRMFLVEEALELCFEPSQIDDTREDESDVEMLYLLLVEKHAIRLNLSNLTGSALNEISDKLEVGKEVEIVAFDESEFTICGQKITIHTVNLLLNAIVKSVEDIEGKMRVRYGEIDSKPMYISYTGFKTIDEAIQEKGGISEYKEKYIEAHTFNEYREAYREVDSV